MRSSPRIFLAACVATMLMLVAACGGGSSGGNETSDEPLGDSSQLLVANPSEALGKSVDRFEDNVESVTAKFTFDMGFQDFSFGANGSFAYRAPDSMHMVMNMDGGDGSFDLGELGDFEILVLDDRLYMKTGLTGWMEGSFDDFGGNSGSFQQLLEGHAPLDYQGLVENLGADIQNLGDTTVDGKTYTRLRIDTDFSTLLRAISGSLGDSGFDASLFPFSEPSPITMDILIDPATLLPYTFDANGRFNAGGESMDFTMSFQFFDYNGPVNIPPAPADAKPFEEGFRDAFRDLNAGE